MDPLDGHGLKSMQRGGEEKEEEEEEALSTASSPRITVLGGSSLSSRTELGLRGTENGVKKRESSRVPQHCVSQSVHMETSQERPALRILTHEKKIPAF